ncbi:DUF1189 domain-containing protein [Effusibacillus pohliae]|uniref:DUF1189 domain-containing protein n=1 Tax=Effusibacillus pohliae TaxID=232270 RepID=UPI00036517B5|nr:DUF1189 domain-containing protein [Effusibacillus pohliae]
MIYTIWHSIRRPASYKRLTQQKLWRLILTLFVFFTSVTGVKALMMANSINQFVWFMQNEFPAKMPPFHYNGSELLVDGPTPVTLTAKNGYSVIVDVSAPVPRDSLNQINSGAVFGKTELYVLNRGVQQSFSYKNQLMLRNPLTKHDIIRMVPFLKPLLLIALVIGSLGMIGWSFVQITLFSFLAMLIASLQRIRLSYRQAWLIAAFSLIPASLIDLLNFFLQSHYLSLAFWVAVLTYMHHGMGSFKKGDGVE